LSDIKKGETSMKLSSCTIQELEQELESNMTALASFGNKYAEDRGDFEDFEDKKKMLLASLMGKHEGSQSFKEQKAYTDEAWAAYLSGLSYMRREFYKSQVIYEMKKSYIDLLRTLITTRREEVKRFKGL